MSTFMAKLCSILFTIVFAFSGAKMSDYDYSAKLKDNDNYVGLKDVYSDYFDIGVGQSSGGIQYAGEDFVLKNFNSLTNANYPEDMKSFHHGPKESDVDWSQMDYIANYCRQHNLRMRYHQFFWDALTDGWWLVYDGDPANGKLVTKEVFYERAREYVRQIVTRYGDIVDTWDVVNEPFYYTFGSQQIKDGNIKSICGDEWIPNVFRIVREELDKLGYTDAKLCLNDCKVVNNSQKQTRMYNNIKKWLDAGVPIDTLGIECHWECLTLKETGKNLDKVLTKFEKLGLDIQITEITVYTVHDSDSFSYETLPEHMKALQNKKYHDMFEVLRKHKDHVSSVTFWGANDSLNGKYRNKPSHPTPFDENSKPKETYWAIVDF